MTAHSAFRDVYDRPPTAVASAPGRVNLIGGHTDYNEGFVLPVAVDRRTAVAVAPRDDGRFRLRSTAMAGPVAVDELPEEPLADHADAWANYPLGVLRELRESDIAPLEGGLDLLVTGTVPHGAGLSSSAALNVATAAATFAAESTGATGAADDLPRRELAEAAWRAETGFVGLNCGIMDQYASALCRAGAGLFLDCRSKETESVPVGDDGFRIVVVDTRVEHELAGSAYNERVRECEEAAERLGRLLDDVETLRDVSRDDFVAHADTLPGVLRRRVRHVVTENERVVAAVEALTAGELDALGTLLFESHASLRDDYEVSCAELDAVVTLARQTEGVAGARMTGGGFGGSVVALVAPDAVDAFETRIEDEYPNRVETDVAPQLFVCETADGVRVEQP
jgi:galactokinase